MNIRKRIPKTGTRKLYKHLRAELLQNNIKMGRDALFNLLRSYGLLVKKTRRFHITTNSNHFFYKSPNLLKELEIMHAEQAVLNNLTQQYDPYENAVAERINGILKYEFGLKKTIKSINIAQKMVKQAVQIYNNERLHWSLDLKTPQSVHLNYNQQKYKSYAKKSA